jgi:hypothetical protein
VERRKRNKTFLTLIILIVIVITGFYVLKALVNKKIELILFPKKLRVKPSLVYYGLIKDNDSYSYLAKLCEYCKKEVEKCSSLELDYANQIVISSRITFRKYIYFRAALVCTISAVLTPVIFVLSSSLFKTTNYIIKEQYKKSLLPLTIFIISSIITWKLFLIL